MAGAGAVRNTPFNRERLSSCPGPHRFERVPGARLRETFRRAVCFGHADVLFVEGDLEGIRVGRHLARREMFSARRRRRRSAPILLPPVLS